MGIAYKIYMVFESVSTEGKFIPLLYTATDDINANAILPSDSTTYTFPSSGGTGEKEVYLLKDEWFLRLLRIQHMLLVMLRYG